MSDRILELKKLCFRYPGMESPVIDRLDFEFYTDDRIGIFAPNGAGKSTLFFLIMGLLKPDDGSILHKGRPAETEQDFIEVRKQFGLLFQDSDDQLFFPSVLEDVAFGPLNLGYSRQEAIDISIETLSRLGLRGFENRITHKLSGGEKRLVALATILAMKPEVLLLDEPGNGLDEKTSDRLVKLLNDTDLSYMIISHNPDFLARVTTVNYTIKEGHLDRL